MTDDVLLLAQAALGAVRAASAAISGARRFMAWCCKMLADFSSSAS